MVDVPFSIVRPRHSGSKLRFEMFSKLGYRASDQFFCFYRFMSPALFDERRNPRTKVTENSKTWIRLFLTFLIFANFGTMIIPPLFVMFSVIFSIFGKITRMVSVIFFLIIRMIISKPFRFNPNFFSVLYIIPLRFFDTTRFTNWFVSIRRTPEFVKIGVGFQLFTTVT